MKKIFLIIFVLETFFCLAQENHNYLGYYYLTEINDNDVNLRDIPSLRSKKIGKLNKGDKIRVVGISKKLETIDNHYGYWLKIQKLKKMEILITHLV